VTEGPGGAAAGRGAWAEDAWVADIAGVVRGGPGEAADGAGEGAAGTAGIRTVVAAGLVAASDDGGGAAAWPGEVWMLGRSGAVFVAGIRTVAAAADVGLCPPFEVPELPLDEASEDVVDGPAGARPPAAVGSSDASGRGATLGADAWRDTGSDELTAHLHDADMADGMPQGAPVVADTGQRA